MIDGCTVYLLYTFLIFSRGFLISRGYTFDYLKRLPYNLYPKIIKFFNYWSKWSLIFLTYNGLLLLIGHMIMVSN
jgi:hypothetical protein